MSTSDEGYRVALDEARKSKEENGYAVGAAVVSADGKILGRGRNMKYSPCLRTISRANKTRVQNGSPILHVSHLCRTHRGRTSASG